MKTAEELLKEFRNENSYKLNLAEFTKALAEHDAEIKALIDEMIEYNQADTKTFKDSYYGEHAFIRIEALRKLKAKL